MKCKKYICARFGEFPKVEDFKIVEEDLPELEDGDILLEARYWSVDAGSKVFMDHYPPNSQMIGAQVGIVLKSLNPKFPEGSVVFAPVGWRTHTVFNPDKYPHPLKPYVVPDLGDEPMSLALSLGITGNSAYFGFLEICEPKPNEVVAVTTAAGAVGSLVGQIAKIKGCRVIGITGSNEKCEWIKNELQFDNTINYKTENVAEKLKEFAPAGIDCYFDNVGGEISSTIIKQMKDFGRISVCGAVSLYNTKSPNGLPPLQIDFILKQLTMKGFVVYRWNNKWLEGVNQMLTWVKEGKIKCKQNVAKGLENAPTAFIDLLNGKNIGKSVVEI